MGVTLKPWLATRKMRLASSSTTCPSSPRWRPWPRPAAICFNSSKATRRKPQEAFSSAYPGNKLRLTAKTSKSKKVTKLGLSVLWRRDSALRVSLTNLELLKSLPRRRRVNLGKKRSFLKASKKNPIPSHTEKRFTISILKKKNPQLLLHIGLLVILPNSTLSVFNNKQNIQKTTEKHLLLDTVCFFGHYTTIPYLQSPISQVFSTILYYSPEKSNVLTKT